MIAIRGLKKRLGAKQVLDGVDLDVATGQTVVVAGPSGTGKSVLLKHVLGLIRADEGSIEVDGEEVVGRRERLEWVGLLGVEHVKPASLSGGMRKRVGLARAIAMDPRFMLYDEPTTGLDPIMADVIDQLIRSLQRRLGVTSIVVTHDMHSAFKIGDRIAMLLGGRIVFNGTPAEMRDTQDPVVRQFLEGSSQGPIQPV